MTETISPECSEVWSGLRVRGMGEVLLITDDPAGSVLFGRSLGPDVSFSIHDLSSNLVPTGKADAVIADVGDLSPPMVERMRNLLVQVRRNAPLVVLLRHESARARLQAVALGATLTLSAPFDPRLIHAALVRSGMPSRGPSLKAVRKAETAREFYQSVFTPERPITPTVIDNGTEFVGQAIQETGIRDWIAAVRQFDDATHQHCLLVAGLAAAFASNLGLGSFERQRLTRAALLHDVGKIHIPASILNKPGKLDDDEMALVRLHPEQGYRILADQGFEQEMLGVVRSHHEMLDGSGYPDRIREHQIPDLVRVVTICDIYAALIERRPYKAPMPGEKAFGILKDMTGRLDQVLVDAFHPVVASLMTDLPQAA